MPVRPESCGGGDSPRENAGGMKGKERPSFGREIISSIDVGILGEVEGLLCLGGQNGGAGASSI